MLKKGNLKNENLIREFEKNKNKNVTLEKKRSEVLIFGKEYLI